MSAFLYSKRIIKQDKIKWIWHRYMQLIVPSVCTVIATLIVFGLLGTNFHLKQVVYSILAGLGFEAFVPESWMFRQNWFLTYILLCYLTVPLIQNIDFKGKSEWSYWGGVLLSCVVLQGLTSLLSILMHLPTLSWGILLRFYLPYSMFRRYDPINIKKPMLVLSILSCAMIPLSCFIRYRIERNGVFSALAELFFIYTQTLAGTVCFYWLYQFFSKINGKSVFTKRLIAITDKYSYPVYLTHCLFIGYSTSIIHKFENHVLGIIVALLCTAVASILLEKLAACIRKKFRWCDKSRIIQFNAY